ADHLGVHLPGRLAPGRDLADLVQVAGHGPSLAWVTFPGGHRPKHRVAGLPATAAVRSANGRPTYRPVAMRRVAELTGQVSARGHQAQYGPGLRSGDRPNRNWVDTSAAPMTRSAACSRVPSVTSSACHSPESRKKVATRYGGTPVRSRSSNA